MRILKVRDVEIGKGIPKIIAPICDKTEKEILHTAKKFSIIPVDFDILDIDIVELINSGERNVFVQFNENSHFGSSFQGDNEKSLLIEIEKLKLSLSHCQQLLEEKEGLLNKLVEQKDNEIKLLREMVELLKKG